MSQRASAEQYDPSCLAPLGLVLGEHELQGRKVAVIDVVAADQASGQASGTDSIEIAGKDQALVTYDEESGDVTVVQPNDDGSYWRKIVRNKVQRTKEQRRVKAAKEFFAIKYPEMDIKVGSTWGPQISTSGTAKAKIKK